MYTSSGNSSTCYSSTCSSFGSAAMAAATAASPAPRIFHKLLPRLLLRINLLRLHLLRLRLLLPRLRFHLLWRSLLRLLRNSNLVDARNFNCFYLFSLIFVVLTFLSRILLVNGQPWTPGNTRPLISSPNSHVCLPLLGTTQMPVFGS